MQDPDIRGAGRRQVQDTVRSRVAEPVPLHLRNAPTRAMKQWGYGKDYQHAHQFEDAITDMACLPESLVGTEFYQPLARGVETKIAERLAEIRRRRAAAEPQPKKAI